MTILTNRQERSKYTVTNSVMVCLHCRTPKQRPINTNWLGEKLCGVHAAQRPRLMQIPIGFYTHFIGICIGLCVGPVNEP